MAVIFNLEGIEGWWVSSKQQWRVFLKILEMMDVESNEVDFTVRWMADQLGINKGTVSSAVRHLEKRGMVVRLSKTHSRLCLAVNAKIRSLSGVQEP